MRAAIYARHNRKEIHYCNPYTCACIETRLNVCTIIGTWIMLSSVTTSVVRAQAQTCATCALLVQIARWRDCCCCSSLLCIQCKIIIAETWIEASSANSKFWNFVRSRRYPGTEIPLLKLNSLPALKFQILLITCNFYLNSIKICYPTIINSSPLNKNQYI